MKNFLKKSWLVIAMFIASFTLVPTTSVAQSGYSTSHYYANSWGSNDQRVGWFYDAWGNYCENWKKMVWSKHYGSHQVRLWNYNTGSWYYEWRESYYYTYQWYFYTRC